MKKDRQRLKKIGSITGPKYMSRGSMHTTRSPKDAHLLPRACSTVLCGGTCCQLGTGIGWHTFRHTYPTMLRHLRVDVKVQQELLRHADIHTTLNVYTQGVAEDLREAHSRVCADGPSGANNVTGLFWALDGLYLIAFSTRYWRREWDSNPR